MVFRDDDTCVKKHRNVIPMREEIGFINLVDRVTKVFATIPHKAGTIAVNFSRDRFRQQNWVDATTQPWRKRKDNGRKRKTRRSKRGVLIDTARLMRSIRKIHITQTSALIGTDVDYGQVHNDGLEVKGTANVKAHTRVRVNGRKRVEQNVKAHKRNVKFKMPKRQFIGASAILDKKVERMIAAEILKAIKT